MLFAQAVNMVPIFITLNSKIVVMKLDDVI